MNTPPNARVEVQPQSLRKNKVVAVILGLFAGIATWIYTYDRDKKKFWVGYIAQVILVFVAVVLFVLAALALDSNNAEGEELSAIKIIQNLGIYLIPGLIIVGLIMSINVWAFIDRLIKPRQWYENYHAESPSKTMAIIFAVFFSYMVWLYTYEKNSNKFWIAFGVSTFGNIVNNASNNTPDNSGLTAVAGLVALGVLGIYVWGIVDAAIKDQSWYDNYIANCQEPATVGFKPQ